MATVFCVHAEDDGRFRFAVMGCMHLGICDPQDYRLAVEKIKQYNPDFVLFLGSMVDTVGEKAGKQAHEYSTEKAFAEGIKISSDAVESLWKEFDRITDGFGVPVYDVPSERCIPANNLEVTEKSFLQRYKKRYYSFEYKNNLFICLDSESHNRIDQKERGLIDGDQLHFLKNSIADASKYNNVFIAMHQSAWHPWFRDGSKWYDIVHPLINKKVKYVFGACVHILDLREVDEVTYVTSGAAPCWPSSRLKPSFFHFLIVDVNKKKVSIKVVPVEPISIENLLDFKKEISGEQAKIGRQEGFERLSILQPSRVIETINIKPGMCILDIGAGTGMFTFAFAEALKGTGKVFATDIEPNMIEYIKEKMRKREYKNVFPVLVKPEGGDPFYKQHSFDIIFLSNVYELIHHPEDYLKQLRPSLAKERGRLYIIYFRTEPDFNEIEFGDFREVIKVLASKEEDFPVFQRLREETKYFIKNWQDNDIPPGIQAKIIEDFNKVLSDRWFFNDLLDYYLTKEDIWLGMYLRNIIYPADFRLAKWLIARLDANGIFDKNKRTLTEIDKRRLRQLNRILLMGIFQTQRLYEVQDSEALIYFEKNSIISTLKAAGYHFVREYDFLEHFYFLEFKRKH